MDNTRAEPYRKLIADRELWQHGSAGQVRVVFLLKFFRQNLRNEIKVRLTVWRTGPGEEETSQTIVYPHGLKIPS